MKYRTLGKTGIRVPVLSYGGSSLGSVFRPIDEAEGIKTVHRALECGINYLDCSPFYGLTVAETLLGKALKGVPRDSYILSTKAGRFGWDEFDYSYERILTSADESMARLGVDYLDILSLHDIEYQACRNLEQALDEGIAALLELKCQGKVRFIGVTAYPIEVLRTAIERVELDTVMSHNKYILTDRGLLDLLPLIQERGIGLINAAPLAEGLLTSSGVAAWHPATKDDRAVVERAIQFCLDHGTTIEQVAIQFSIANDAIPTTLVSTANPDRIAKNAALVDKPYDDTLTQAVRDLLKPLWNRDWQDFSKEDLKA